MSLSLFDFPLLNRIFLKSQSLKHIHTIFFVIQTLSQSRKHWLISPPWVIPNIFLPSIHCAILVSFYVYLNLIQQIFTEVPFAKHHTRCWRPHNKHSNFPGLMEQHLDLQLNKGLSAKERKHSMQSEQTEGVQPRWRREERLPRRCSPNSESKLPTEAAEGQRVRSWERCWPKKWHVQQGSNGQNTAWRRNPMFNNSRGRQGVQHEARE